MKAQFIDKLVSQPWHIGQESGRTIIGQMLQSLVKGERPAQDFRGDSLPKMQVIGDVALIPICGILMLNVPDWIKAYGFNLTDANDIEEEIDEALQNPAVSMLVLDIDSPGGESIAGDKLFDLVEGANKKKPVYSYCRDGGQMCSSAYECAAPSRAILCGKYAQVGCIGSFMVQMDDSEYWKSLGINWEVFRSGSFKGIGIDKVTDEQRSHLQAVTDSFGARFRANVSKYRTAIDPADMQGQWFIGAEAASRGFAHGLAKNLDSAVVRFRKLG